MPQQVTTFSPPVAGELPEAALLARFRGMGAYTDCYQTDVPRVVTQAAYIEAFYTTRLFKLERWVLSWLARRPSTDAEAAELAQGQRDSFAAWHLEERTADQLLMCDFLGNTRSWLMTEAIDGGRATRLCFGSAIVPGVDRRTGEKRLGVVFRALLGFHRLYSRALLRACANRLTTDVMR